MSLPAPIHLVVVPAIAVTGGNGVTITFDEEGELVELLQPLATTVTTAVPENPLLHVTTPPDVIEPAPEVMLQV